MKMARIYSVMLLICEMDMSIDDPIFLRRMQLITVGAFALALVACDPKPSPDQEDKRSGAQVEQKSGTVGDGIDNNAGKVGQRVDDLALNIKVEDALKENAKLKSLEVKVYSTGGVVTLSGTSDTEENIKLATQIVMNVNGVRSVQNKLVVVDG